jgi:hypothetical protein
MNYYSGNKAIFREVISNYIDLEFLLKSMIYIPGVSTNKPYVFLTVECEY